MKRTVLIALLLFLALPFVSCADVPTRDVPQEELSGTESGGEEASTETKPEIPVVSIVSNRAENGYEKADLSLRSLSVGGDGEETAQQFLLSQLPEESLADCTLPAYRYFAYGSPERILTFTPQEREIRTESGKAYLRALFGEDILSVLEIVEDENDPLLFCAETEDFSIMCGIGALGLTLKGDRTLPLLTDPAELLTACLQDDYLKKAMEVVGITDPEIAIHQMRRNQDGTLIDCSYGFYQKRGQAGADLLSTTILPVEVLYTHGVDHPYMFSISHADNFIEVCTPDTALTAEDAITNVLNGNFISDTQVPRPTPSKEQIRSVGLTYQHEEVFGPNYKTENRFDFYIPYYVIEAEIEGKIEQYLVPYANFDLEELNEIADASLEPVQPETVTQ